MKPYSEDDCSLLEDRALLDYAKRALNRTTPSHRSSLAYVISTLEQALDENGVLDQDQRRSLERFCEHF
jgi:hypothetical protein